MIRLLCTDFDGTLVDHDATPPVVQALYDTFAQLKEQGVLWAVNTGRDLPFILEGLQEYRFPFEPDYILTNERQLFHRNARGEWQDYGDWNRRCEEMHNALFEQEAEFLERMFHYVKNHTQSETLYENDRPVGIKTTDDDEMDRFIAYMHSLRPPGSRIDYQRSTLFLRFCHAEYSKGSTLGELARLEGIAPDEIFTVGDHHNDLSMLNGRWARWAAAPGNAIDEVKQTVLRAGGYVANQRCSEGVLESLHYFFERHNQAPEGFRPLFRI